MEQEYTEKQKRIKDQFCAERGKWKWHDTWETLLSLNEDLLSAYSRLSSLPHKKGHLDKKTIGMIYVAIDSAITHLYTPGMRNHLKNGLENLGITKEEFMEVFAIATTIGASTFTVGIPILVEQLKQQNVDIAIEELTENQKALKGRFVEENGYWSYELENILKLDMEMLECFMDYIQASLSKGALDPKIRELIYIAVNAAPTTLNKDAIELHVRKALDLGATKEEIIEVFESVACLGIHTVTVGVPVLNEVLKGLE